MQKYTYINKATGQKVYSDQPLDLKNLELVTEVRDASLKASKKVVRKKN